jgi:hypothetical protein
MTLHHDLAGLRSRVGLAALTKNQTRIEPCIGRRSHPHSRSHDEHTLTSSFRLPAERIRAIQVAPFHSGAHPSAARALSTSLTGWSPAEHATTPSSTSTGTPHTARPPLVKWLALHLSHSVHPSAPTVGPLPSPVRPTRTCTHARQRPRRTLSLTTALQTIGTFRHWPWLAVCLAANYDATGLGPHRNPGYHEVRTIIRRSSTY